MTRLAHYRPPPPGRLLAHILERPELVRAVRELPGAALGKLIDSIGLEDAGELVALATTEQLERVFDEDLWVSAQAGDDPRFDPKRFGTWLEVLLESGEAHVVKRLTELPLEFVTLAVSHSVLVLDIDVLGLDLSEGGEEAEMIEKALESGVYEEWEEFRLIARDGAIWDSLYSALMALDRDHHELLRTILGRCAAMSLEFINGNGGLYEVLTSDEMLEVDTSSARDDRRAKEGHIAPSDARSFLELARRGLGDAAVRDPATRAYFRELAPGEPASVEGVARRPPKKSAGVSRLLALAGVRVDTPEKPRRSGTQAIEKAAAAHSLLEVALGDLRDEDPTSYAERMEEAAYLANVLVAGHTIAGRRPRPVEALEAAIEVCAHAFDEMLGGAPTRPDERRVRARELLAKTQLDVLFRRGFRA